MLNIPVNPHDPDDFVDEPKEEIRLARRFPLRAKMAALAIVSIIGYSLTSSTLAGNITVNSGRVEFGQGLGQTTACDQDITITPYATFGNSNASTGSYKFTQVKVTNIGTSCYGKDFIIRAYDSTTASNPLTLYQTGGTTNYTAIRVYDNSGTFELVDAGLLATDISQIANGFVVTFFNSGSPQSLAQTPAGNIYKFTVESLEHSGSVVAGPSGSLNFSDTSKILEYAADNNFVLGTGAFTVDLWASVTNAGNQTFYDAGGDVNSTGGFAFWIEGNALKLRTDGVGHDVSIAMDASWLNSYHHYAAVRGNGFFRAYVDGVKKLELADSGYNITRNNPTVGQLNNFRNNYVLSGNLRNLRVVKGTALYNANFTPQAAPLSKVSGTLLLLLVQSSSDPYKDSSDYGWVTTTTGLALPGFVNP